MLSVEDLHVTLGRHRVLEDVTLAAPAGAVTVIVGPNGSGKSTLLRAVTGEIASSGHVSLNGRAVSALKAWQSAAVRAVLPQATALAFPFTVREVVALGLLGAAREDDVDDRPERALARVDLTGFGGRYYQELSGGEQQRVQLARVLCQVWHPLVEGAPRWLFLDEPVSSLDIHHQLVIMDIARDFAAGGGGVVAVLHDLNLTAIYADHVAVMEGGRILAAGTPQAVLTDAVLGRAYGCAIRVSRLPPQPDLPFILPQAVVGRGRDARPG